eukprot:TRINITY_DN32308_c0_g1_i1.p1 TRINITY_DN32308_c0_g1~~TRINITY_DN32308_c0_g1_i1.p1  ORF type:complete len:699 (+),score=142.99 TRINITY_DN32308_c0_g1_i1:355-2451(+)
MALSTPPSAALQQAQPPNAAQFTGTSLYVGDLDPNVSEAQLYEMFSQVGPVVSIRVCRDLITRRSLGYAYVNYNSAQDASRALDLLNFTNISGRPVRIMFSHRDPSLRKSGTANIFIKNLDKGIDHKALHDTFSQFGPILSCKVATDIQGQSKGYGFVQFEQEEAALGAIEKVNGMLLNEKQVFVGPFVRRQERDVTTGQLKFSNVYVKNLGDSVTEEELQRVFGAYGEISSTVVMRDPDGKSKGFGFVNFENADDAMRATEALNGKKFDDKEWYVGRAQRKSEREQELRAKFEQDRKERIEKYQGVNLYLKNLDDGVDDEKLRSLFAEFGLISSCKVMKDSAGQSKGAGFVAFASPDEANKAVAEMNGKMVGNKPLYVALAQRKEERRQRLQFNTRGVLPPVGVGGLGAGASPGGGPLAAMYHSGPPQPHPAQPQQQMFYGQPPPGLIPGPQAGYAFQQQHQMMRPGGAGGPGGVGPNYFVPMLPRQGAQNQRVNHRRVGPQNPQHMMQQNPRGNFRNGAGGGRYGGGLGPHPHLQGGPSDGLLMPQQPGGMGMPGGLLAPIPVPLLPMGGGQQVAPPEAGAPSNVPITALASALAIAGPDQQRAMLGEQLYPLVDALEHEQAGKVTGMLLEMDQTEVLHLIEAPEALKAKVHEAMEVLRQAGGQSTGATANGTGADSSLPESAAEENAPAAGTSSG